MHFIYIYKHMYYICIVCVPLQTLLCIAIKSLKRFLRSVLLLLTSFRVPPTQVLSALNVLQHI